MIPPITLKIPYDERPVQRFLEGVRHPAHPGGDSGTRSVTIFDILNELPADSYPFMVEGSGEEWGLAIVRWHVEQLLIEDPHGWKRRLGAPMFARRHQRRAEGS